MKVLRRVVVIIAALALLAGVVGVIVYGYKTRPGWVGVSDKKFWDYLELLIVPAALALGVYWLNRAQREREREAEGAQQELELAVQSQRAKDAALQAYFDQISQLLIDRDLRGAQPGDNLSVVARARTLTVLQALDRDPKRKRILMQFLYEAQLILRNNSSSEFLYKASGPVISLIGADLTRADLGETYLRRADLYRSDLRGAILWRADLKEANLGEADLRGALLKQADLSGADLRGADLNAASLSGAGLLETNLSYADLRYAKGVTQEQLDQAESLKGATMPDGQKYEDWLKSKGSGEDGQNSGLP